jgi:hypothetical protein
MSYILEQAKDIVENSRSQDYGPFDASFKRIADYWSSYLNHKGAAATILPQDVALMMVLFKIAREEYKHKDDNIIDCVGYLDLYGRLCDRESSSVRESK